MKYFSAIILILIACSTPTTVDDIPPNVTITFPLNGSTVSEITEIKCMASDNKGVDYVELWVDGEPAGVTDKSEPYSLPWNTTAYPDSTNHTVIARAYDINKNTKDSDPAIFTIDNSNSFPIQANIISINYDKQQMIIKWEKSKDSDFKSYELYKSTDLSGVKTLITTITDSSDTTYILTNFDPTITTWYWINVVDKFDYNTFSSGFPVKDSEPNISEILSTNFQNNCFEIKWAINNEIDFDSYTLYESLDGTVTNETQIFYSTNRYDSTFIVQGINLNEIRFYRIKAKDYWGQETFSLRKRAVSYPSIFYDDKDIFIINSDGSNKSNLTTNMIHEHDPQITPDATKIIFVSERDGNMEIYSMDIDGSNQTNLSVSPNQDKHPQISPDGSKIIYVSKNNTNNTLVIMDISGTNKINLANIGFYSEDGYPTFSAQGDKVVFGSQNQIYSVDTDGSDLINLTNNNRWNMYPHFSPDGSKIVFQSDTLSGVHDIFIMDSDGNNQKNLTKNTGNDWRPKFIPDGTKIIFESRRDLNYEIFVMELDGSLQTNLTNDAGTNDFNAHFSPNQLKIVYQSGNSLKVMSYDGNDKYKLINISGSYNFSFPKFLPHN